MLSKYTFIFSLCFVSLCHFLNAQVNTEQLWINEISYDGQSSYGTMDSGEFIELIISNDLLSNTSELAKYKMVLYSINGFDFRGNLSQGRALPYHETSSWYSESETIHPLNVSSTDGTTGFQACPIGTSGYTALYKQMPVLQDLPAGIGLIYDDTDVVQILSYEAAFRLQDSPMAGAAAGSTTELMVNATGTAVAQSTLSANNHSIQLEGSGGNSYDSFTWNDAITLTATPCAPNQNQSFAVLPVELFAFTAEESPKGVELQWKTASEQNNAGFAVERRSELSERFQQIGFVAGAGNSEVVSEYAFTDSDIRSGLRYYYRLRQIDSDGTEAYSGVVQVKIKGTEVQLFVYPNPAQSDMVLQLDNVTENTTLEVRNLAGTIMTKMVLSTPGVHNIDFDVSAWNKGVYIISTKSQESTLSTKLIVR